MTNDQKAILALTAKVKALEKKIRVDEIICKACKHGKARRGA
jgi:hypothetical protein